MDKKDLEEGVAKNGKGDDIKYEIQTTGKETLVVKEPGAAEYKIDVDAEYEKYLNLPEMLRVEFIDGQIYYLGEPSRKHQELLGELHARFYNYLHGKPCKVYMAPFGVKIDFDFNPCSKNTLQPDLLVICKDEKLDDKGLNGAPDLVVEILSPSNFRHDRVFKYQKYMTVGVKEYWLVDPMKEVVDVNLLKSGRYRAKTYVKGDVIRVSILDDLYINVTDLFDGYEGDEIKEIELVREEERSKAEAEMAELLQQAETEKAELLQQTDAEKTELLQQTEAEKVANAGKMIEDGLSAEMIERYTGLSAEEIKLLNFSHN